MLTILVAMSALNTSIHASMYYEFLIYGNYRSIQPNMKYYTKFHSNNLEQVFRTSFADLQQYSHKDRTSIQMSFYHICNPIRTILI